MNAKYVSFLLAIAISTSAIAQPTLTATTNNPVVGDQYVIHYCSDVTPGNNGASQTWDFSSVTDNSTTPTTVVYEACTPNNQCSLFPGTTIVSTSPTTNNNTGGNAYMIASSNALSLNGSQELIQGLGTENVVYSDPEDVLRYPFTYNTTYIDNVASTFTTTSPYYRSGTTTVLGDAYGTLKTPEGTFTNVLRVHSVDDYQDSTNFSGTPYIITYHTDTYTWYSTIAKQQLFSRAELTSNLGVSSTTAGYTEVTPSAVTTINNAQQAFSIYPNPATDLLNITFNTLSNEQVRISLIDVMGREIAEISNNTYMNGEQKVSYNTAGIPKGLYLVRLQGNNGTTTKRVEIL